MKRFIFSIQVDHVLSVNEIWPNGDAPEDPTVKDVFNEFLKDCSGHIAGRMTEWNIAPTKHDLFITELKEEATDNGK